MSGIWCPGDLALCVHGREWVPSGCDERHPDQCSPIQSALAPRPGSLWVVDRVLIYSAGHELNGEKVDLIYLVLHGQPSDIAFDARHYRKIDKHEADAEDEETIRLLNGSLLSA